MDYTVSMHDNTRHFFLNGQFTFADNQKFKAILETITSHESQAVQLNFSDVSFIDSAGLGMLLLTRDECQKKNIPISLKGAHGQVQKIFSISKFDQLFTIV